MRTFGRPGHRLDRVRRQLDQPRVEGDRLDLPDRLSASSQSRRPSPRLHRRPGSGEHRRPAARPADGAGRRSARAVPATAVITLGSSFRSPVVATPPATSDRVGICSIASAASAAARPRRGGGPSASSRRATPVRGIVKRWRSTPGSRSTAATCEALALRAPGPARCGARGRRRGASRRAPARRTVAARRRAGEGVSASATPSASLQRRAARRVERARERRAAEQAATEPGALLVCPVDERAASAAGRSGVAQERSTPTAAMTP